MNLSGTFQRFAQVPGARSDHTSLVDRPWWFKLLGVITVLSVAVVVIAGLTPVHAGGSNEDGIPSSKCGTIAGLLSHPSRSDSWKRIDEGQQLVPPSQRLTTPLAGGCKIAMFPSAMVMVIFSLVGIVTAVTLAVAVSRKPSNTVRHQSSATGPR
jgi:hypothetical protein